MGSYRAQLIAVLRATVFHSPTTYSWFGRTSPRLSRAVRRALTPKTARDYLLFNLQNQLYNDVYCQGFATPTTQETHGPIVQRDTKSFVEALSAANSGIGHWNEGWQVRAVEDGKAIVRKADLELHVDPATCLLPHHALIAPFTTVSLRFPKELLGISPGFYMAVGNRDLAEDDEVNIVRVYWNLAPDGAVVFMRHVTTALNQANLPFRLKVLNNRDAFTRCDAVVLYIYKGDYDNISSILACIYPRVATYLNPDIPAFTKRLAQGVGLAEDPGQEESFGQHRCRVLADGMIRAYEADKKSLDARLQVVEERFAEEGLTLEAPFLNAGSVDCYHLYPGDNSHPRADPETGITPVIDINPQLYLQYANEIGQRLLKEAIWCGGRCNWIGAAAEAYRPNAQQSTLSYTALGGDIYSGTSGVALFLAELCAATGDAGVRRTALGAARQALSLAKTLPSSNSMNCYGLYVGWIGVALAAAYTGMLLGVEELLVSSRKLLWESTRRMEEEREFDLLSGNAGAIVALVILQDILDDVSLLDTATQLGDELLHRAEESVAGYSWKSTVLPTKHNLTGFSHGVAGVGYGLMELFHATNRSKYLKAAQLAFNYERYYFDADLRNWPDFRDEFRSSKPRNHSFPFATYWCHGAPGIALSRLRAYKLLQDEVCKAEAATALDTTRETTERMLRSSTTNFSLCHGLAGNAEVLLYGYQVLGQKREDDYKLAMKVATVGIESYAKHARPWPCGTNAGETPSLMLGLAGIGYFYLRLYNSNVPCLLMIQREQFRNRLGNLVKQDCPA